MFNYIGEYVAGPKFAAGRQKNRSELWNVKGIGALGAYDPVERVEALGAMGMRAQFAFYNTGSGEGRIASPTARAASRRYNDYGLDWQRKTGASVGCDADQHERCRVGNGRDQASHQGRGESLHLAFGTSTRRCLTGT